MVLEASAGLCLRTGVCVNTEGQLWQITLQTISDNNQKTAIH